MLPTEIAIMKRGSKQLKIQKLAKGEGGGQNFWVSIQ